MKKVVSAAAERAAAVQTASSEFAHWFGNDTACT
jgi:hypothetical protein